MNLVTSSEDILLGDSARRWLQSEAFAAAAPCWREFAQMGWLSLPVAESAGGAGASDASLAVFIEQLGYACCDSPYMAAMMAAGLLGAIEEAPVKPLLAAVVAGDELIIAAEQPLLHASSSSSYAGGWMLTGSHRSSCCRPTPTMACCVCMR